MAAFDDALRGRAVLVVDDDPDASMLMRITLENAGASVEEADSVTAALELAADRTFALVLLDMHLADGEGIEVLARWPRGEKPAAVALTGDATEGTRQRLIQQGVDALVLKPTTPDQIIGVAVGLLRARQAAQDV